MSERNTNGGLNIPDISYDNQEEKKNETTENVLQNETQQSQPEQAISVSEQPVVPTENNLASNGTNNETKSVFFEKEPKQQMPANEHVQQNGQTAMGQQHVPPQQPFPGNEQSQQAPTFSQSPQSNFNDHMQQGGLNQEGMQPHFINQQQPTSYPYELDGVKGARIINFCLAGASYLYGMILMFMHHGAITTLFFAILMGLGIATLVMTLKVKKGTKGRALGITASILSIAGFLIGWFPFANIFYLFVTGLLSMMSAFMLPTSMDVQKSRVPQIAITSAITVVLAIASIFTVSGKIATDNYYKAGFMADFVEGFTSGLDDALGGSSYDTNLDDYDFGGFDENMNPDAHDSGTYDFFYDITPENTKKMTDDSIELNGTRFKFLETKEITHGTKDYILYEVEVSTDGVINDSYSFSGIISDTQYIFESSLYDAEMYGKKLESAIYDNMRSADRQNTVKGYIAFPKDKNVKYIEIVDFDGEYGSNRVYVEV